ncbi:hypothetical protein NKDENANG_00797 [Candidatus Entotheonellaceae bacterium PAL068K]
MASAEASRQLVALAEARGVPVATTPEGKGAMPVDPAPRGLEKRPDDRYQGRVVGTDLHNPSFAKGAKVFGARGLRVQPEGLDMALHEALEDAGPTVIEGPAPIGVLEAKALRPLPYAGNTGCWA